MLELKKKKKKKLTVGFQDREGIPKLERGNNS